MVEYPTERGEELLYLKTRKSNQNYSISENENYRKIFITDVYKALSNAIDYFINAFEISFWNYNFPRELTVDCINFFSSEGYIKNDLVPGMIQITHQGIIYVEKLLKKNRECG